MARIRSDVANSDSKAETWREYVESLNQPVVVEPEPEVKTREELKWGNRYGGPTSILEAKSNVHQPTRIVPKRRASQSE